MLVSLALYQGTTFSRAAWVGKQIGLSAPAVTHSAHNCRTLARQRKNAGAKAQIFLDLDGPTKVGPDTKHQSGDSIRLRAYRRFGSVHPLDLPDVVPETRALNQKTPLYVEWRFCVSDGAVRYGSRPVLARSSAVVLRSPSLASDFFAQTVMDLLRIRSPLTVFVSEAEAIRTVRRLSSERPRDGRSIAAPRPGSSSIQPVR